MGSLRSTSFDYNSGGKETDDTIDSLEFCDNEQIMITITRKKEGFTMKIFLFKPIWRKFAYIIPICSGPYGNPALMRNDPFR